MCGASAVTSMSERSTNSAILDRFPSIPSTQKLAEARARVGQEPHRVQEVGRPVMYNTLVEQARHPGRWRQHLTHVEETARKGIRAVSLCNPGSVVRRRSLLLMTSDLAGARPFLTPVARRRTVLAS